MRGKGVRLFLCPMGQMRGSLGRPLLTSSVRSLGGAFVSSEFKRFLEAAAIVSTASRNAASFTFDGLWKPLTFFTYCSATARISSSVTGSSKLKSVLMFLHIASSESRTIVKMSKDIYRKIRGLVAYTKHLLPFLSPFLGALKGRMGFGFGIIEYRKII